MEENIFEPLIKRLEDTHNVLKALNDDLGYTARYMTIWTNIKSFGWETCRDLYHPDNNIHDDGAVQYYELVKFVYEDMKAKGEA